MASKISSPPQNMNDTFAFRRWLEIEVVGRLLDMMVRSVVLTPASVPANSTVEQTFSVSKLTTDQMVIVSQLSHTSGIGLGGVRVSAANTLAITYMNVTAGAITPTSGTYDILTIRK